MQESKLLVDKRFGVALGLCVLPDGTKPMYAGPHYYGKLTYENLVEVQAIVAKYQEAFNEMMKPVVAELIELGVVQAGVVEDERKGKAGDKREGRDNKPR